MDKTTLSLERKRARQTLNISFFPARGARGRYTVSLLQMRGRPGNSKCFSLMYADGNDALRLSVSGDEHFMLWVESDHSAAGVGTDISKEEMEVISKAFGVPVPAPDEVADHLAGEARA